mgnify:FL=1
MERTRRAILGTLGTGAIGALGGCSLRERFGDPQTVTIEVGGDFDTEQPIELEVLPATVESGLSENVVFQQTITVGPSGPEEALSEIGGAFESERALIRVHVLGLGLIGEYTFVPDCPTGATYDEVLYVTLQSVFDVTFRQNRCQ